MRKARPPRVRADVAEKKKVVAGGHFHVLGGHLREVEEPRLFELVSGDDRGSSSRLAQLEDQVVEQLPRGVALVAIPPPL